MRTVRGYWKRFAGSVIDSAHKYRFDPFFRTEVNLVALQSTFALVLLALLTFIARELYYDASAAVSQGISAVGSPNSTPASIGLSVVEELAATRDRTIAFAALGVVAVTALFTYIIARIALGPTRNALQSQKQFIGNVAHELRTPLSVSKTNLEVALMTGSGDEDLKKYLVSTVEELDRISEIINNLLTLSASIRPERMEFSSVDLGAVVQEALRKLNALSEPKKLEMEARISERRAVWGNPAALEQIVMNILKNAVFYTGAGGRVLITVEPVHPDLISLTVRDSGRGIARKDLFRIFEPYFRADPSRARNAGGSGLGLTIVSELVKLHNGKITVRSAEGRGTTVSLLIPAARLSAGIDKKARKKEPDNASEIAVDFSQGSRRG